MKALTASFNVKQDTLGNIIFEPKDKLALQSQDH